MIIKRVEKDGVVKAIYKSSNVLASKYDKESKVLSITFNKGNNYTYAGVPMTDYTRFEIAESQGKILNTYIKQYPFVKGEVIDPALIIAEVDKHQMDEIKEIELKLVKTMGKVVSIHDKKGVIEDSLLTKVQYYISKLNNEKNG